jgi:hypothetical protein
VALEFHHHEYLSGFVGGEGEFPDEFVAVGGLGEEGEDLHFGGGEGEVLLLWLGAVFL